MKKRIRKKKHRDIVVTVMGRKFCACPHDLNEDAERNELYHVSEGFYSFCAFSSTAGDAPEIFSGIVLDRLAGKSSGSVLFQ